MSHMRYDIVSKPCGTCMHAFMNSELSEAMSTYNKFPTPGCSTYISLFGATSSADLIKVAKLGTFSTHAAYSKLCSVV